MNVRVIANPISGGGRGRQLGEAMRAALRGKGLESDLFITSRAGEAQEQASQPGFDCVVSVGGDGTTNEVANGIAGTGALLAILPLGTANVVARQLGIPQNAEAVAELIARNQSRTMDVGLHRGRRFLLGAGAGPDAAIVARIHSSRGKRLGIPGYFLPTLRVLSRYAWPPIRVVADGKTLCDDGHYAIVANCRFSAGVFRFTPNASVEDCLLDVCVMRRLSMPRLAVHAVASWLPRFTDRAGILYRQAREVVFEPQGAEVPLQVDGDPAGQIPAAFSVEPGALRVVAP
ncbi:MAG: diacylglycerol kinase family lipid kinase [Candidatus Hydrogenedentes bacterium]|nr:diacylglycerol kinase family lipid kinase [Candidatus Hydrogenedentota bacterium]